MRRYVLPISFALSCLVTFAPTATAAEETGRAVTATEEVATTLPPAPLPPGKVEVFLEDLHCKTCAKKVTRKLYALRGVRKVETSLKRDLVVIYVPKNQPVEVTALWQAITAGGVKPTELRYADQRLDTEAIEELLRQASRLRQAK